MAITVDDLPAAGSPVPGWSKSRILNVIADTLQRHRVPDPVGFFNGANMDEDPATRSAVEAWLGRGFSLGNHTFSHVSADAVAARVFERDIERDQEVIVELEQHHAASSTYFRYPYLERGAGRTDRRIRRYLAEHKYRIADVSVDFEDWAFFSTARNRLRERRRSGNVSDERARGALRGQTQLRAANGAGGLVWLTWRCKNGTK